MIKIKGGKIAYNVLWNTAGSLFYLLCQWLLSVIVVRLSADSYADAGILSLAMSISTFFSVITLFNVRNYQVSDSKELYSSSQYVFHRLLTCGASLLLCGVFVLINSYDTLTSLSIIAYMLVKLVEGFADVLHGVAQRKWRLDIAGKSFIIRGILLVASFSASMLLFKNLAIAILSMAIATLIPLIFYDLLAVRRVEAFSIKPEIKPALSLTKVCLPMVAYGACINAIVPFARYFLEFYHGETVLGYYASVSAVAVLVQAFVTFVFTPLIGVFEDAYSKGDKMAIAKLLLKLFALLVGITALAMLAVLFLGEFAMVLVFGEEIREYVYLLYPTIIASALTALVWLLGMLLVVMRDSVTLLVGALCGFVGGLLIAVLTIKESIYKGTNASILIGFALISIIYIIKFLVFFFKGTHQRSITNDGN